MEERGDFTALLEHYHVALECVSWLRDQGYDSLRDLMNFNEGDLESLPIRKEEKGRLLEALQKGKYKHTTQCYR